MNLVKHLFSYVKSFGLQNNVEGMQHRANHTFYCLI